ncbi:uncharacterized protein Ecym_8044 [Eremothecium cymbalariae DBVPG|uniref:Uncharacterized protein n=1 Tax=Eremothecium cymbalariae (strain CBS 270.75 / DBVPG 7215 / KCTC 17166 / NRRL Y-17582) TaxID=931890 RepID=G8JWW6_ERECY|nr:Hypothetical protein Ecym_8044 [Eremothecium cymbalariae DBVPG\
MSESVCRLAGLHEGAALSCDSSRDGKMVISSGIDGKVGIWDVTGEGAQYEIDSGVVNTCVRLWQGSSQLLAGCANGKVCIYDVETGRKMRQWGGGHKRVVNEIVGLCEEHLFGSVSDDGTLCWWDSRVRKPVGRVVGEFPLLTLALGRRGDGDERSPFLYTSGVEPVVRCYDLRKNTDLIAECETTHATGVSSLCVSSNGSRVCSLGFDDNLQFHDIDASGKLKNRQDGATIELPNSNRDRFLSRCSLMEGVRYVLAYGYIIDIASAVIVSDKLQQAADGCQIIDMMYNESTKHALASCSDGTVLLYSLEK